MNALEQLRKAYLKVKGPNVMLGYLNHPGMTEELIQDGWYTTGDLGMIDEEGLIRTIGHQSRFSRVGGEMVPHIRIEQEIARIIDQQPEDHASNQEESILCAVTAVPDSAKGERLVVLHRPTSKTARRSSTNCNSPDFPIYGFRAPSVSLK